MRHLTHRLSGRVSAHRRHRFAVPVVVLLGLLATGGLYAAIAPAQATSSATGSASVAQGRALFEVGCASCHGKNGEGIMTVRGNNQGPSLVGVGAAAVDFQVGTGRMPMAQPGVQALQKPQAQFTSQEISDLAAFVASLGPGPAIPSASQYAYQKLSVAEMVQGGLFFRTNCTACHNFAASGGALPEGSFAPNLNRVSAKHMYEAMLTGPQEMPIFGNQVLSPKEKTEIIAYIKANDATPNYGGFALGSLGPVSEGMFAWGIGIGSLVLVATWIAAHTAKSSKKREENAA